MSAPFGSYARHYDLLYGDKDYEAEARYVASRIRSILPAAHRILDLGCGTGAHAEQLVRMGFAVDGIDSSEAMLEGARARRARLPQALVQQMDFRAGDMRSARLGRTYDAVISLFHAMCYQTTDGDLRSSVGTAAAHLMPGGVFLFDFWHGPAVEAKPPQLRIKRAEDEDVALLRIAEPVVDAAAHRVDVHYTLVVEPKQAAPVQVVREVHPMRYLFPRELAALAEGRFDDLGATAWMGDQPLDDGAWSGCQLWRFSGNA